MVDPKEVHMKIKRYTSASMRLALDQVRAEQGPEAVILSSRRIDEGVEVIAAVDYDESLMTASQRPPDAPARAAQAAAQAAAPAAAAAPV
ncbi:MAG: flagellar biosynthesis protein FlhF, partial [Gammaproteobacteria bacterium]|nr:flagellar biosynthesis protein FlhF [Gammaproteobacteria bacterium]